MLEVGVLIIDKTYGIIKGSRKFKRIKPIRMIHLHIPLKGLIYYIEIDTGCKKFIKSFIRKNK